MPWQPRVSTGGSLITSKCPGGSCHRGRPTGCSIKIIYDHRDGGLKAPEASHKYAEEAGLKKNCFCSAVFESIGRHAIEV